MTASKPAATSLFLDDIALGEEWRTGTHIVTAAQIAAFAELTRDHHPLHTDEAYCRSRGFPRVIAHGLFGLSLMEGLKTELRLYEATSIASLGWDKVHFRAPVLDGDELHLRMRFTAKRPSRNPDRGVVTEFLELVNARGEVVIDAEHASLILTRNAGAAA
jgi:acyl dehydratase